MSSSSLGAIASPVWLGIDVAKAELVVAWGVDGRRTLYPNTAAGHRRLIRAVAVMEPPVAGIVLEATGPYHALVVETMQAAGLRPSVLNPQRIAAFRRSLGKRAKNDRDDARVLAHFGAQQQPVPARVATRAERQLRELVARREDLVGMRTAEKTRRQVTREPVVRDQIEQMIGVLTDHIHRLDAQITACMTADPTMAERRRILQSMPGIGPVISAVLVAYLPELGDMTRRQLAALAGLAPYDQESGQYRGQRRIAGGRAPVRRALYQAVQAIYHRQTVFTTQRHTMEAKHKPRKVILIAIARRMGGLLNAMVRDGLLWHETTIGSGRDPNHARPASLPSAA